MKSFVTAVLLAVCLLPASVQAGPRSQSGFAGAGGLRLVAEPTVDVVTIRADVTVRGDEADVRITYGLKSRGGARSVRLAFPAGVRVVERDGPGNPPPPWRNTRVFVDGTAVEKADDVEPAPYPDSLCGDPPPGMTVGPAFGHVVRTQVRLAADKVTSVELRFTATLSHDDWRTAAGSWERSERRLCLRLRPLAGYQGQGMPLVDVAVRGAPGVTLAPGKRDEDGTWRYRALVVTSGTAGDFQIAAPAPWTSP